MLKETGTSERVGNGAKKMFYVTFGGLVVFLLISRQFEQTVNNITLSHVEGDKLRNVVKYPREQPQQLITDPTDPIYSTFIATNTVKQYKLCDTLEIYIEARDKNNVLKTYGGDYFWVRIYNSKLRSSVAADDVTDHENGSYTATIQLHWTGRADVAVRLVHSSEQVSVMNHIRDKLPVNGGYVGRFQSGGRREETPCHVTADIYKIPTKERLDNATRAICNFTDEKTGFPWFCVKPEKLPCETYHSHNLNKNLELKLKASLLSDSERQLLSKSKPHAIRALTPYVVVRSNDSSGMSTCDRHSALSTTLNSRLGRPHTTTTGFYYDDQWVSFLLDNKTHFGVPQIRQCLQNQTVHIWGDSTIRQWYEYFAGVLKESVEEHKSSNQMCGPHFATDKQYNIRFEFRHHGRPVHRTDLWTSIDMIQYVPNMMDEIGSDGNQVILLTLWAHFVNSNRQFYQTRWKVIKESIARLKSRNPNARVIIKTANTGFMEVEWYIRELDQIMRDIMSNDAIDDVTILDVWDMTLGHRTGFNVHPKREVISQEIDMVLSILCPKG